MGFVILTAIGIIVMILSANGSKKVDVGERAREKTPDITEYVKGLGQKQFLNGLLNLDDRNSFQSVRSIKTVQGSTKWRATQTYAGLEVFGAGVVYSVNDNQDFAGSLSGEIFVQIEEDIADINACMLDDDHLFVIGKQIAGIPADSVHCSLKITQRIIYPDYSVKANLAYIIDLYDRTPNNPRRPFIILNACNKKAYCNVERISKRPIARSTAGKTLKSKFPYVNNQPTRHRRQACPVDAHGTGGNLKTGDIVYGTDPRCLNVQRSGSVCTLESSIVKVIDLDQTTDDSGRSTYSYDCNTPDDEINGAKSANLDAFFYGETVNAVFQSMYNMSPLTFQLILNVHYGDRYENAFFDGTSMTFGDGDTFFYPLTGLDVTAHEIAHGITDQNSGLIYSQQSGGINEAFSDITGEAVEYLASFRAEADPPVRNDWMVGAEIIKDANFAIRYFDDPTKDGSSISHINDFTKSMDVHFSSGIFNKAFYELVVTQGVDMVHAYGSFLDANKIYWGPDTGFVSGACGVKSAAMDRGVDAAKVDAAFSVVGIDLSCCGTVSLDTLPLDISNLIVSDSVNPCYSLRPRSRRRKYVAIKATSNSGELITITISLADCGSVVDSRVTNRRYKLPLDGSKSVVCFSAGTEVNDVTVKAKYCRRRRCRI